MDAGILRVEKHDDRLCFRNPGLLRLPIEMIYEGGNSKARNPKIQNMLRMVGYGENLGSGFPLILDAWKQAGWDTPVLNNKFELDMVELVFPLSAVSEKVPNRKDEITPSAENDDGEKSREKSREKNINIIRNNPTVTQLELSNMLRISPKAIEKHIKNLREDGIIRRVGPDKGGHWEVTDD
jgi:predicted HTH transcriptional regulator